MILEKEHAAHEDEEKEEDEKKTNKQPCARKPNKTKLEIERPETHAVTKCMCSFCV